MLEGILPDVLSHHLSCISYHASATMHQLPGISYHASTRMHQLACISYHTSARIHRFACISSRASIRHASTCMHQLACVDSACIDLHASARVRRFGMHRLACRCISREVDARGACPLDRRPVTREMLSLCEPASEPAGDTGGRAASAMVPTLPLMPESDSAADGSR